MSIPNLISLGRLLSVPLAVYLILVSAYGWAFALFCLAGLSDAVDGLIAKRLGQTSSFGALLDPIADKTLLVAVYVALAAQDAVPIWLVILVVFRDLLIIGGVLFLQFIGHSVRLRPLLISKVNTAAQLAFAGLVLGQLGFWPMLAPAVEPMAVLVATTTIASGGAYLVLAVGQVGRVEGSQ